MDNSDLNPDLYEAWKHFYYLNIRGNMFVRPDGVGS